MKRLLIIVALLFQSTFIQPIRINPMASIDEIQRIVQQMRDDLPGLIAKIKVNAPQILTPLGLSEISKQLGLFQAGEFRVGNSKEPGFGFSGTRIGYPPFTYNALPWNIAGVNNDALQFGLSATDGTAWAGAGAVRLTSGGILIYNGAIQTGAIEADGDFRLGSNLAAASTTSFQVFTNDQTYNSESVGAGDVLIGDNSTGKPNIFWDKSAGKMSIRSGVNVLAYLDGSSSFAQIGLHIGSISQNLTSGASTAISFTDSFGLELWDDAAFWSSGNPTRITIPYTGVYEFQIRSQFANNTSGQRYTYIDPSDASSSLVHTTNPTGGAANTLYTDTYTMQLTGGVYVEILLMQDSGSTITGSVVVDVKRIK